MKRNHYFNFKALSGNHSFRLKTGGLLIRLSVRILVFLLLAYQGSAQIKQTARIDFVRSNTADEEFMVLPLKEEGVAVLHSKIEPFRKNFTIDVHRYDSTLTHLWSTNFEPDPDYSFVKTFDNEHFIYILLRKSDKNDFGILRVDFQTGDRIFVEGNLLANMDIQRFKVLKSKAFIGGKVNERPVVVMFSMFDKTSKVLPDIHANHLEINDIGFSETTENIYVMLKNDKNCQYVIKTYNYEGKNTETLHLGGREKTPISGEILNESNRNLLVGSYAEGCSLFSLGLYLHDISKENSPTHYYNFADFNNFFGYMKEKREEKIKSRIREKKRKGKEVKLRYRLLLHEIIPTEEGWMMIAEIFYPEYKTSSGNLVYGNWRNYRIGSDMYNNFRYTHAVICSFDKNGKLLWDNSINLNNIESNELLAKVQYSKLNDKAILAYPDDDKIKTVLIQENQKAKTLEIFDLKSTNEKGTIVDSDDTNLTAWYGNHFLAYGYQSLRKENATFSSNVFFINKLSYLMNPANLPNRQ